MKRCVGPACPFRVRHGFPAEFADRIERCRSCGGALEVVDDSLDSLAAPTARIARARVHTSMWRRLGWAASSSLALLLFARSDLALSRSGLELDWAQLALRPGLTALVLASLVVHGLLRLLPTQPDEPDEPSEPSKPDRVPASSARRRQSRARALTLLLATPLAAVGALTAQSQPDLALGLCALVGPPLLLTLAFAIDRGGLGTGMAWVVATLSVDYLLDRSAAAPDPTLSAVLAVVLALGVALWIARPARQQAMGRRPSAAQAPDLNPDLQTTPSSSTPLDDGLGLGLRVPSTGLAALLLLAFLGAPPVGQFELDLPTALGVVTLAGLALAWIATSPAKLHARWARAFPKAKAAALDDAARALFKRALMRSLLLLLLLTALPKQQLGLDLLSLFACACVGAATLDLAEELRWRRQLDPESHELAVVELDCDLLTADIAMIQLGLEAPLRPQLQAGHLRSLFWGLGPFIPLRALTLVKQAARARQLSNPRS